MPPRVFLVRARVRRCFAYAARGHFSSHPGTGACVGHREEMGVCVRRAFFELFLAHGERRLGVRGGGAATGAIVLAEEV